MITNDQPLQYKYYCHKKKNEKKSIIVTCSLSKIIINPHLTASHILSFYINAFIIRSLIMWIYMKNNVKKMNKFDIK